MVYVVNLAKRYSLSNLMEAFDGLKSEGHSALQMAVAEKLVVSES